MRSSYAVRTAFNPHQHFRVQQQCLAGRALLKAVPSAANVCDESLAGVEPRARSGFLVSDLRTLIQAVSGYASLCCRRKMLQYTDSRVKLMNQLLVGIRVLKMYAWEVSGGALGFQQTSLCTLPSAIRRGRCSRFRSLHNRLAWQFLQSNQPAPTVGQDCRHVESFSTAMA